MKDFVGSSVDEFAVDRNQRQVDEMKGAVKPIAPLHASAPLGAPP